MAQSPHYANFVCAAWIPSLCVWKLQLVVHTFVRFKGIYTRKGVYV